VDGVLRLRPHIAFAKLQVTVGSLWERGIVIFRADGDLQVTPFGNDCIKYQKFAAIDRVSRDGWSERIKFTKKQKDVLGAKEMPQVHRARRA
jgi:hypothetical protein